MEGGAEQTPALPGALLQNSLVLRGFTGIPPCVSKALGRGLGRTLGDFTLP